MDTQDVSQNYLPRALIIIIIIIIIIIQSPRLDLILL